MWNKEMIQKLIEQYKHFRVLWDISSPLYKNKLKKQNAFESIAMELNVEENEVKNKIHNLRTQFLQEVRRIKQRKIEQCLEDVPKSKWEFFDALKFIVTEKDVQATANMSLERNSLSKQAHNFISKEEMASNYSISQLDEHETVRCPTEELPSTNVEQRNKKRKHSEPISNNEILLNKTVTSLERPIYEILPNKAATFVERPNDEVFPNKTVSFLERPIDDYQIFGAYVASEFRLLKSDKNKLLLRRKIQRAILDISEIDALENYDSSSSDIAYTTANAALATPTEVDVVLKKELNM